jgi:hypothetical protein
MSSQSPAVSQYLGSLPDDRRAAIAGVRNVIRKHLPSGYEEQVRGAMISYEIPLSVFPDTYNKQPLCYAALAVQKHHNALYLMTVYGHKPFEEKLRAAFAAEGKKLDMGKACVRFQRLEDLPLDAIGGIIAAVPPARYIEIYEASRPPARKKRTR